ncbi:MAG: phage tail assembly chaperone [Pontixanthobacter sp.]
MLFADDARRAAGFAAQALGWRPGEFWAATPADLRNAVHTPTNEAGGMTRDALHSMIERDDHG